MSTRRSVHEEMFRIRRAAHRGAPGTTTCWSIGTFICISFSHHLERSFSNDAERVASEGFFKGLDMVVIDVVMKRMQTSEEKQR